jgi:hypothetical protein
MKYKAKESYKKLPMTENYCHYKSASTHLRLMAGLWVECDPPKELLEHLEPEKKASK